MSRELKQALASLDAETHESIRVAYYKAMEGLSSLRESLSLAAETNRAFLSEAMFADDAIDMMERSRLGEIV